jgi:hypothetical protein
MQIPTIATRNAKQRKFLHEYLPDFSPVGGNLVWRRGDDVSDENAFPRDALR